ncbi:2-dehydro-3-deoxygalactonokinase [Atlantibacter sp.]|uniref:2-dehydro-3-deoxygalactonokinase n=1 Tax=Atlantibacter sp. TaxID=1903473 RepID=UPI0028AC2E84|nr:2-dehydro-3-deoxygalactonokinase [Atlantibacter sp.]
MSKNWLAVDWGTTNFRAWLMHNAEVVFVINAPCGLLQVENGQFEAALQTPIAPWTAEYGALPVLMAGMVGSQQGWVNVPYCEGRADAQQLAKGAHTLRTHWGSQGWILPGVAGHSAVGLPEVMRGEEIQLIGLMALAPAENHLVILPGTHSKHATVEHNAIHHFSTFMTGELFQLLMAHSLLGRDLPPQQPDSRAFALGVQHSGLNAPLSQLLFSVRTLRLRGDIALTGVGDYLSGLLIGQELRQCPSTPHWIIGSDALNARYQQAASQLGLVTEALSGERCFIAGMNQIRLHLQGMH